MVDEVVYEPCVVESPEGSSSLDSIPCVAGFSEAADAFLLRSVFMTNRQDCGVVRGRSDSFSFGLLGL